MKAERIADLLPLVIRDAVRPEVLKDDHAKQNPLEVLLQVMEAFHGPVEEILEQLDRYLDPRRAPEGFVRHLATWVDIDFPVSTGVGRLRELVARFADVSGWSGTRAGLIEILEIATGVQGFDVRESPPDDQGVPQPFHIQVLAPRATLPHRPMLEAIIRREKPAYVTSTLAFQD